eukprot:1018928-Pelagomonas_calceolata.AAC.1
MVVARSQLLLLASTLLVSSCFAGYPSLPSNRECLHPPVIFLSELDIVCMYVYKNHLRKYVHRPFAEGLRQRPVWLQTNNGEQQPKKTAGVCMHFLVKDQSFLVARVRQSFLLIGKPALNVPDRAPGNRSAIMSHPSTPVSLLCLPSLQRVSHEASVVFTISAYRAMEGAPM